jgi:hypothetical protein
MEPGRPFSIQREAIAMFLRFAVVSLTAVMLLNYMGLVSAQDSVTQAVIIQNELDIPIESVRVRLSREYHPINPFVFDVARSVPAQGQVEFPTSGGGRRYVWAQLEYRARGRTVRTGAFVVRPAPNQSGTRFILQIIFRVRSVDGRLNQAQIDEEVLRSHDDHGSAQPGRPGESQVVSGQSETGSFDAALAVRCGS